MIKVALERLLSKIEIGDPGECWRWLAYRNPLGYGMIGIDGERHRAALAHRVVYELFTATPIPPGLLVRHTCDNPGCVNPLHLLLGTDADNARDRVQRGRGARPSGTSNGRAKLTPLQVWMIRASEESCRRLATRFGVSAQTIHAARTRKTWKDLP